MSYQRALLSLSALVLASCSSLTIRSPQDNEVFVSASSPPTVSVVVEGQPSLTTLNAMKSGRAGSTDVLPQMSRTSPAQFQGMVNVDFGKNKVLGSATVPCWYCSGGSSDLSIDRTICVYSGPVATPEKTAFSVAPGNLGWSLGSGAVVTATFAGSGAGPAQRWVFRRVGGIGSSGGLIFSAANSCLCMRSMAADAETPIGLAICDSSDLLQLWSSFQAPGKPPMQLRIQNNGRGASDACLTQKGGSGTVLVQRPCQDTPEQLWTVRDNASGQDQAFPFQ